MSWLKYGKEVNAIKAERDGYKTQLDTAQASLKAMEGIDAAGLQTKVTELTDQLQGKDAEIEKIKADYAFDASRERSYPERLPEEMRRRSWHCLM